MANRSGLRTTGGSLATRNKIRNSDRAQVLSQFVSWAANYPLSA
jgi:hypothetical protein